MSTIIQETLVQEDSAAEGNGSIQLVSFCLARKEYGIEITKIRENILMGQITRVPQTPHYVKGLINLRGTVIPVIDLRARFGLPEGELTHESRTVVLNVAGKMIGIIVDAVSEVLRVTQDQIAPSPPTVAGLGREYLNGLVKLDERLLILLNIDNIFTEEDTAVMNATMGG